MYVNVRYVDAVPVGKGDGYTTTTALEIKPAERSVCIYQREDSSSPWQSPEELEELVITRDLDTGLDDSITYDLLWSKRAQHLLDTVCNEHTIAYDQHFGIRVGHLSAAGERALDQLVDKLNTLADPNRYYIGYSVDYLGDDDRLPKIEEPEDVRRLADDLLERAEEAGVIIVDSPYSLLKYRWHKQHPRAEVPCWL